MKKEQKKYMNFDEIFDRLDEDMKTALDRHNIKLYMLILGLWVQIRQAEKKSGERKGEQVKKIILIDEVIEMVRAMMNDAEREGYLDAYKYLCELLKWLNVRNY